MLKLFKPKKQSAARRPHYVDIDGRRFPVEVANNPRAKRLTLRLKPDGRGAKITTPAHVSESEIASFLDKNKNWIAVRLARAPKSNIPRDGGKILYEGISHTIIHLDRPRGLVEAKIVAGEPALLVPGDIAHMSRRVIDFMKKQARNKLNSAVQTHALALDVKPKSVRITDSKSRWGSCSSSRTLSFSWRVVMAPPEVLDYLAAHEVAHLREMNHSERFWKLVEQVCPQMRQHKTWLRRNGQTLHAVRLD